MISAWNQNTKKCYLFSLFTLNACIYWHDTWPKAISADDNNAPLRITDLPLSRRQKTRCCRCNKILVFLLQKLYLAVWQIWIILKIHNKEIWLLCFGKCSWFIYSFGVANIEGWECVCWFLFYHTAPYIEKMIEKENGILQYYKIAYIITLFVYIHHDLWTIIILFHFECRVYVNSAMDCSVAAKWLNYGAVLPNTAFLSETIIVLQWF